MGKNLSFSRKAFTMIFKDRLDAGEQLAKKLTKYKNNKDALILAIPRGGLQIGNVLAKKLNLKLDIILTKKIGYPGNPEYAIGAVSLSGQSVNQDLITSGKVSQEYIDSQIKEIRTVLKQRYEQYRGKTKPPSFKGKIVIITDDGIATGSTLLAAIELLKQEDVKKIVIAIPVGPPENVELLKKAADEVICLSTPLGFSALSQFYENFTQVEDEEAIALLKGA